MNSGSSIEFGTDAESRFTGHHALAPILIGLLAPVMVLFAVDPRALKSASVLLHIYIGAIFVIATIGYIISVIDDGEVTKVSFDKDSRTITVEKTGVVAKKKSVIPFADVASLRMETRYDDDGYKASVPLLVLSTRETIALPAETTDADVAAMRELLGR